MATMEQDKPFKTIEVVDSRTGQRCKVACMSCIRGHRTTSCGIPVCRTKIFWTVKRPGRPSNSCTCRFGPGGRCRCAVAKSACPHKPKKGEKRTVECRCDEQGRYCCVLEPEQWDALNDLQNPRADFYPNREALENHQFGSAAQSFPPTPAHSMSTPQSMSSVPSTPAPMLSGGHTADFMQGQHNSYQSPPTTRFGMMGVGAPMGSIDHQVPDVLAWQGQAPPAPREYHPHITLDPFQEPVAQSPAHSAPTPASPYLHMRSPESQSQYQAPDFAPVTQSFEAMGMQPNQPQAPASQFDFDKMTADYFSYQFPNAICQNCGLHGCTCKNCPAVMQNFGTGSWAQCCSRKHTRDPAPPAAAPVPSSSQQHFPNKGPLAHQQPATSTVSSNGPTRDNAYNDPSLPQMSDESFTDFNMEEFKMTDGTDPLDISEFLMTDLEQPNTPASPENIGGCCCGGDS